jgi:hypothetical protein
MNSKSLTLALPFLLLASCASLQDYVPGGGDVRRAGSFNIGQRVFDHASANCLDEQPYMGFEYTVSREDGAFGYEFGLGRQSDREEIPTTGDTSVEGWELTAGLRREFPIEGWAVVPYAGIGLSGYRVERDNETAGFSDVVDLGGATYARLGATMKIDANAFIGIDVRFIQTEWFNEGLYDLDGDVVSLVLGFSF